MFLKNSSLHRQKGSSLMIAFFLMGVVALLGVSLLKMSSSSSKTIAYQVNSTRALAAANAGAERRLNELFPLSAKLIAQRCDEITSYDDFGSADPTGLSVCTIVAQCSDFQQFDVVYYHIESTGTCGIASRTIIVDAKFDQGTY